MRADRFTRAAGVLAAVAFLAGGAWSFADPASFYEQVARFPPYNEHFLHDIGAFQLGIGAAVVVALLGRSGLQVALWGAAVAAVAHAAAHWIDWDAGGRDSDPVVLSLLAAVILAAALRTTTRKEANGDANAEPATGVREGIPARATRQRHD
jgi:hypothetical protein